MRDHGMLAPGDDDDPRFRRVLVPSEEGLKYLKEDPEMGQYWEDMHKATNGEFLVDRDTGEAIGHVFVHTNKHDKGFIFNVEVTPKYRRQGYGWILIDDAVRRFGGEDLTVDADNTPAINLYLQYGFTIYKKGQWHYDPPKDELWMKYDRSKLTQESTNIFESGHFAKYKDDVLGFNDEGMAVMKKCDCGGKISIAMKGEPIYTCESCGKTYGCVPFQEGFSGKNSYSDEINQLIGRIERYEKILRNERDSENKDKIRIHLAGLYRDLMQKVDYAAHDAHIDDTELNDLCDLGNDTAKKYVQLIPNIKNPSYGMIAYQYAIVAQVDWVELRKFINKPDKYSDFLMEWLYLRATGSSKDPTNDKLPKFKGCKEIAQFIKGEITYEEASHKCNEYVTEAILNIVSDILNKKSKHIQEGAFQDLKNGVNPYSDDLVFHVSMDKHIDGQVWKPRVPDYLDPYNPEDTGFEDNTIPRICFSTSIEGALNGITVNIQRQSADTFDKMYVYVPEKPWKEYKHKTNKQLVNDKLVYDANVTREVWIMEPVRMKLYGVIRVDQIADAKRKAVVPTSKGQKDTRNYFTYKWHWVVKPKVLKKATKFDYSPERVIDDLCIDIKKFKYGLIKDGRLMTGNVSDADYDKYWVFHSGETVDQAGGGNCYDMVEYEAGYLEAFGVAYKKYFMNFTDTKNTKTLNTHTICVVPLDGKFVYIEQAFKRVVDEWGYERKKVFDKLTDIFEYVAEVSAEYDNQDLNYGVWDYTDAEIDYGTPIKNFQEWIMTKCKMIHDGEASKPKSVKESFVIPTRFSEYHYKEGYYV
jgi:ribosomal protein S18 acetylase RimI-like enzyme